MGPVVTFTKEYFKSPETQKTIIRKKWLDLLYRD